jgi:hypothetical protein
MNCIHATVGLVCVLLSAAVPAQPLATVAFVDVNVVPMDRERVLMHQTVLVRDGDIAVLGSRVEIPLGARRIEGGGNAWLIPGLADMHSHLASGEDAALYAAAGVTTVLQMGGEGRIEPIPVLRAMLAQAPLAPQVFFAFMLDGEQPTSGGWPIHSIDEARFAVRVAKDRQYDFVKVYNGLRAAEFAAIVDESRKAGLAVIGHGVRAVGLPASLAGGEVMVAHAEEFYYTAFGTEPDASKLPAVVDATRRSGAYVTLNLSAIDAIARQWGRRTCASSS